METLSRHAKIQTSETFLLSAILALSGGFQDAYTYNVRNGVFSNAQTGNVVLMSQHLMEGNWMRALHYLFPVLAFAFGVLVAERIGHTYKNARKIHWRQIVVLIEILILLAVGFMPQKFNMARVVCLCDAGSDVPEGKWLWLCEHDVYRKLKKRNREPVRLYPGAPEGGTSQGTALLWNHIDLCNRCRCRWNLLNADRRACNLDILCPVACRMPAYD